MKTEPGTGLELEPFPRWRKFRKLTTLRAFSLTAQISIGRYQHFHTKDTFWENVLWSPPHLQVASRLMKLRFLHTSPAKSGENAGQVWLGFYSLTTKQPEVVALCQIPPFHDSWMAMMRKEGCEGRGCKGLWLEKRTVFERKHLVPGCQGISTEQLALPGFLLFKSSLRSTRERLCPRVPLSPICLVPEGIFRMSPLTCEVLGAELRFYIWYWWERSSLCSSLVWNLLTSFESGLPFISSVLFSGHCSFIL